MYALRFNYGAWEIVYRDGINPARTIDEPQDDLKKALQRIQVLAGCPVILEVLTEEGSKS